MTEPQPVRPQNRNRSYTFALVFKSRDPQALNQLCGKICEVIPDAWVVFRHGPSFRHLWVIEAKAPSRGDGINEQSE